MITKIVFLFQIFANSSTYMEEIVSIDKYPRILDKDQMTN